MGLVQFELNNGERRVGVVEGGQVREVQTLSSRDYLLRLADGGELRMSRNYRERFSPRV